jgi:hypothetical protein
VYQLERLTKNFPSVPYLAAYYKFWPLQKAFCVLSLHETKTVMTLRRHFLGTYVMDPPSNLHIIDLYRHLWKKILTVNKDASAELLWVQNALKTLIYNLRLYQQRINGLLAGSLTFLCRNSSGRRFSFVKGSQTQCPSRPEGLTAGMFSNVGPRRQTGTLCGWSLQLVHIATVLLTCFESRKTEIMRIIYGRSVFISHGSTVQQK